MDLRSRSTRGITKVNSTANLRSGYLVFPTVLTLWERRGAILILKEAIFYIPVFIFRELKRSVKTFEKMNFKNPITIRQHKY